MENQASSKSIILNNGLYYGIVSIVFSVILYAMDMHLEQGIVQAVGGFAIMIAFVVMSQRKFKLDNSNLMSFGQAVKVGMGVVLVATVIGLIYNYIFATFIEPDMINQVLEKQKQAFIDSGLTDEQIEAQMKVVKQFSSPLISSAIALLAAAFFGFVVSAISGAILKRSEE